MPNTPKHDSAAPTELLLFVGHPFAPRKELFDVAVFRKLVSEVVRGLNKVAAESGLPVLRTFFEASDFQVGLNQQLELVLERADCALLEVSDANPNVMYEAGFLTARSVPTVLLRSKRAAEHTQTPSDVRDRLFIEYEGLEEIRERCFEVLLEVVRKAAAARLIAHRLRRSVWFPANTSHIHVIGPPSYDSLPSESESSSNFVYLDKFGDKDAVLDVVTFLSRRYRARVITYTADDFPRRHHLSDNLVIIGGPGGKGLGGNAIARDMIANISSRVSYSEDCESMTCDGIDEQLEGKQDSDGRLTRDFGYFARFPNPFNPSAAVVMIHGIHTGGVRGAALALSDRPEADRNLPVVLNSSSLETSRDRFEAVFSVDIQDGQIVIPRLDPEWVFDICEQP